MEDALREELHELRRELELLRERLVAHHELGALSDEVIARAYGPDGNGQCPICREALQQPG